MSGKIYNKNLTFLQDQPFAENLLTGFYYKKKRAKLLSRADSFLAKQMSNSNIKSSIGADTLLSSAHLAFQGKKQSTRVAFGSTRLRNKSEKMRKAEASLVKHFCSILERFSCDQENESLYTRVLEQSIECSSELKTGKIIPHLLSSVDSMQNTLLVTRNSRSTERIKAPSHFKKILRESRKIRLLYGNLSRRHLSRGISKMRFPGETLLIWLESRLDVVLERCGFFGSVKAARQSVLSGNIVVNSKVVKSPGFVLEGGDIIKVIQKQLLFNPLLKQFSRGAILSDEIFPSFLRKKNLLTALSNSLQKPKSTSYLNYSLTSNKINKDFDNMIDKNLAPSRSPRREFYPYKSFYTWLLKKKQRNFQSSDNRGRQSNALLARELQLRNLSSQNTVDLEQKNLSLKNWRFIGSPHLLFSLFLLHGHLQKVISFLAHLCNKGVSIEKALVKLFSYKTQKYNNTSTRKPETTHYYFNLFSFVFYRTHLNFPTIFSTSKECVVTTFTSNTSSCLNLIKKREGEYNEAVLSLDTLNIELFLNLSRQSLQEIKNNATFVIPKTNRTFHSQSSTFTNIHKFFGEKFVRVLTELYDNLLPWFISSNPFSEYSLRTPQASIPLARNQDECLPREKGVELGWKALSQLVSDLVKKVDFSSRNNAKEEKSLLSLLLPNLLLYSLLIKKELASLPNRECAQFEKEQVQINNKIVSRVLPVSIISNKKQKTFNSRLSQVSYKKFNLNQRVDLNIGERIKPLHLEVSYQSLCAVYLFPPQRVCLPVMVDLDCLAKAL